MKLLTADKAVIRRRLLRINIFIGILVFIVALGLMVTGEYSNLAERQAADAVFNYFALGGIFFAIFSWMFCIMSKPFWFPVTSKSKE